MTCDCWLSVGEGGARGVCVGGGVRRLLIHEMIGRVQRVPIILSLAL